MKSRSATVFLLLMVIVVTGMSLIAEDSTRSDDARVRWETERARWDQQRRTWDTEPGTYKVSLPDFHHSTQNEVMDQANEAHHNLRKVADEALMWVMDERLSLEQRFEALALAQLFSPELTAGKLVQIIDFQSENGGIVSGRPVFGKYPAVEVLRQYGSSVLPFVNAALANETVAARQKLLCDVVQHVAGAEMGKQQLETYIAGHSWKDQQHKNLEAALAELETRAK